jgi:hypothetical protein
MLIEESKIVDKSQPLLKQFVFTNVFESYKKIRIYTTSTTTTTKIKNNNNYYYYNNKNKSFYLTDTLKPLTTARNQTKGKH